MTLDEAFPKVDCGVEPLGARIVVQIRATKKTSSGGIILVEESKETEKWNTQVAKLVKKGPLAWCNRETGEPWKEGMWAEIGDFIRIPRWGGDRFEVHHDVEGFEPVLFVIFNDHEAIAKFTADPLKVKNFFL